MAFFGKKQNPLDDALFDWPDGTPFCVYDMLRSCEIKGITGSGKSSGSLQHFLNALAAHPRATILAIAQKPEDRETFEETFARAGKRKKLIVIDKNAKWRTNLIDVERAAGADARGIVAFLNAQKEMLGGGQAGGVANEAFWRMNEERMLFNTVEAVRQGTGGVGTPELMEFIATAPTSPQTLDKKNHPDLRADWEQKFHFKTMLAAAERRDKSMIETHDFSVIANYWAQEFPHLDPEPRSAIMAGVMNTLHAANTGLARLITSTDTNISPKVFDEGYSVLVDFPYSEFDATGRYIAGGWKYLTQKHILRRKWKPGGYFNVLVCDEFQQSVTEMDATYLSMCRSHGGCLLTATQTIHSELGAAGGGQQGHHKVDALLANFGHHIYHTVDPKTAQFASELLGHRLEMMTGGGEGDQPKELWDEIMGRAPQRWNFNHSYQPVLQPAVLMGGLRTGGKANGYCVDGVVIRLGERFFNGENYQFVTFRQR